VKTFSIEHTVHFDETNLVGNVYFAHYVRWQGLCREEFLMRHAPTTMAMIARSELALVTLSTSVDYLDECFAGDTVTITMTPADGTRGHRIAMAFGYLRHGRIVARGRQQVACMERAASGLVPAAVPADLAAALATHGGPPPAARSAEDGPTYAATTRGT
jgi:enediyne biosynthesis thioesterase